MVTQYGMSKRLGAVDYGSERPGAWPGMPEALHSPETAEAIEQEIRQILDKCHARAVEILTTNRVVLEDMAQQLLDTEMLDGARMMAFLGRVQAAESLEDRPTGEWVRA